MTENDERIKDLTGILLEILSDEDPEDFSPLARRVALELSLELGQEQCQRLYHFAVMVSRMAR